MDQMVASPKIFKSISCVISDVVSKTLYFTYVNRNCPRLCILSSPLHLLTQGSLSCLAMELYHF